LSQAGHIIAENAGCPEGMLRKPEFSIFGTWQTIFILAGP